MAMEPDLIDFLQLIKPHYHTAISTNRTNTMDMVLDIFNLRPWFEIVVTALTAPRPKPAPDGLYMILEHFGLQPDQAIYIGDSDVDREHCAGAGMKLIAFKNPDLIADYHVQCFMDIAKLPPFIKSS
jgi:beta-phosphoglucomutase-like phosphatase (HAD superfamily)